MESSKERARFCGNILVRKTKRKSFLAKSLFEGVFGVLSDNLLEYYRSSAQWVSTLVAWSVENAKAFIC